MATIRITTLSVWVWSWDLGADKGADSTEVPFGTTAMIEVQPNKPKEQRTKI